jgi:hypothetical protein
VVKSARTIDPARQEPPASLKLKFTFQSLEGRLARAYVIHFSCGIIYCTSIAYANTLLSLS